jgi:hypothetical protein
VDGAISPVPLVLRRQVGLSGSVRCMSGAAEPVAANSNCLPATRTRSARWCARNATARTCATYSRSSPDLHAVVRAQMTLGILGMAAWMMATPTTTVVVAAVAAASARVRTSRTVGSPYSRGARKPLGCSQGMHGLSPGIPRTHVLRYVQARRPHALGRRAPRTHHPPGARCTKHLGNWPCWSEAGCHRSARRRRSAGGRAA